MKKKSSISFKEIPDRERSVVLSLHGKIVNLFRFLFDRRRTPRGEVRAVRNDRSGMTMMEIVISLFIIGLAAIVAASIIISAFQGNRVNKNKLIAISLAREGIEAVRNMRDSNWLRYAANKDKCWNFWEDPEGDSGSAVYTCESTPNRIIEGYYKVNIGRDDLPANPADGSPYTYKWYLSESSLNEIDDANYTTPSDLSDAQLKLWTPDSTNYPDYALYVDNTHTGLGNADTNFYRQIQIEYPNDTNVDGSKDEKDATLQVTSTVVWFEKSQKKKVKLISRLSNYMD